MNRRTGHVPLLVGVEFTAERPLHLVLQRPPLVRVASVLDERRVEGLTLLRNLRRFAVQREQADEDFAPFPDCALAQQHGQDAATPDVGREVRAVRRTQHLVELVELEFRKMRAHETLRRFRQPPLVHEGMVVAVRIEGVGAQFPQKRKRRHRRLRIERRRHRHQQDAPFAVLHLRQVALGDEPVAREADDPVGRRPRKRCDLVQHVADGIKHEQDAQILVALEILRDFILVHSG